MNSFKKLSLTSFYIILALSLSIIVESAPSYNSNPEDLRNEQLTNSTPRSTRRITIQSALGRNRGKAGDLDPQTQNDMRILSLFEHELNKIFSCYVRLSCPRTRSPEVIKECDDLRNWPLYHQVMRMAGIKRYPYQNYAPQLNSINSSHIGSVSISPLTRNHLTSEADDIVVRPYRHQQGRRRRRTDLPVQASQIQ